MAQVAIKGHPTKGHEVIELLEKMGGRNLHGLNGMCSSLYYYIENGVIKTTTVVLNEFCVKIIEL
jgi:hypothetical protein